MQDERATKRVYGAAALLIVAGAGLGFLLRPAPIAHAEEARAAPRLSPPSYSAPSISSLLPPSLLVAAPDRPDCFFLRIAYAHYYDAGDIAGARSITQRGAESRCWLGN